MIFISYTIESGDPKFETILWNQPFYINLDGLEVCPEDPIVIQWIPIYIAFALFVFLFLLCFSLCQILSQKKAHEGQDIEYGDSNLEHQNGNREHEPRPKLHHEADQGKYIIRRRQKLW